MFNRMAVRAQNFQIGWMVVRPVSVYMMNNKNFLMRIIPTSIAFCDDVPGGKPFPATRRRFGCSGSAFYRPAFHAAKNKISRFNCFGRRSQKSFTAVIAFNFDTSSPFERFVIATSGTIFGDIFSKPLNRIKRIANIAGKDNAIVSASPFPFACATTKFKSSGSVKWNTHNFVAFRAWKEL